MFEPQFTDEAADRIAGAVRYVEGSRGILPRRGGNTSAGGVDTSRVRVTSGTVDADGNYPAAVTEWDSSASAWADLSTCKLKSHDGSGLTSGTRYPARASYLNAGNEAVYITFTGDSGAGTIPYVTAGLVADYALTGSAAATGLSVAIPGPGTYLITLTVGWAISAIAGGGGERIWVLLYDSTHSVQISPSSQIIAGVYAAVAQGQTTLTLVPTFGEASTLQLWAYHDGFTGGANTARVTWSGGGTQPYTLLTALKIA